MSEKKLDGNVYRKAQRSTNKCIISLGDDLWQCRRQLRTYDEKAGKLELLTPDGEGAFAAALLHLYKDPQKDKNRDTTLQSNMRRDAITAYRSLGSDVEKVDDPQITTGIRCALSGEYFQPTHVKAAHIVPVHLGVELADYIFGKGTGARLFSVDNCLMLHRDLERAFWFLYQSIWLKDQFAGGRRYCSTKHQEIECYSSKLWRANTAPLHDFYITTLWYRSYDAVNNGSPVGKALDDHGLHQDVYLRQSMLLVLAKTVGDLSEGEIEGLVQERAFDVPERMAHSEEEIARRMLEVHQELGEECLRREENGDEEDE
ncbi:MAG: hypothetical protein M1839_007424 [Geoglossum umbratile]|nr:MAG: hypothetical protein M1839_007424 [Geoglossum umbratile]